MIILYFLLPCILKVSGTALNLMKPLPEVKFMSELEYFKSCPSESNDKQNFYLDYSTDKIINANWTVIEPFDESYNIRAEVYDWVEDSKEWQKTKAFEKSNACETMYKIFDPKWSRIMTAAGNSNGCPIKPGNYVLRNFKDVGENNKPISSTSLMKEGRYKILVKAKKDLKVHVCAEVALKLTKIK